MLFLCGMKKWVYGLFIFTSISLHAQTEVAMQPDSTALCWKEKIIPAFSLLKTDSSFFTEKNLVHGKKTIIMLFSPDCDHCQNQLKLILKQPRIFDSCQLIMVTTLPMKYINDFIATYNTNKYSFITIAQDYKFFFGPYYKLKQVPMLAFYNANGVLKSIYNNGAKMSEIKSEFGL